MNQSDDLLALIPPCATCHFLDPKTPADVKAWLITGIVSVYEGVPVDFDSMPDGCGLLWKSIEDAIRKSIDKAFAKRRTLRENAEKRWEKEREEKMQKDANASKCIQKQNLHTITIQNKTEQNITEQSESIAHARVEPPLTFDEAKGEGVKIGLPEAEVKRWFDWYASMDWRRKPTSIRPMTKSAAISSMAYWRDNPVTAKAKQQGQTGFPPGYILHKDDGTKIKEDF